jgi:[acyl-carrier-protein] S-malonyltransferase
MRVFVFPGQGSQSVGMLSSFSGSGRIVADTFAEASQALGYDLGKLIESGPIEQLNETVHTQPAMLTVGVATWRLWQQAGGAAPHVVCGHSLGEFTALTAGGALAFATAVQLVRRRAELMQEAVPVGEGAIAAVLGLDDEVIAEACKEVALGEVVEPVNFNSPGQVVIAGHAAAVKRALQLCTDRGAKRAVLLPMSVPAHSSLMQPASERFNELLATSRLRKSEIAFWSPVDCAKHTESEDLRALLMRQLVSPVRWTDLVRKLIGEGASQFIECGPGKVLTSLNRRIDKRPQVQYLALQDPDSVAAVLALA